MLLRSFCWCFAASQASVAWNADAPEEYLSPFMEDGHDQEYQVWRKPDMN